MIDSGGTADHADELQRGLVSHCYRMLGSITDAVEIAAKTSGYESATRACLQRAGTRPLPSSLGAPSARPEGTLTQNTEILWLEPIPASLMDDHPIDLGLIAALQRLDPLERATAVHHLEGLPTDFLTGRPGDVAPAPIVPSPLVTPDEALLARYRSAFERYDVPAIVALFTDDAIWEMPPFTSWFRGARDIGRLISTHCPAERPGDQYLVPLEANGHPAFAVYMRDPKDNVHRAFQFQVLTLTAAAVVHAVAFFDLTLFQTFQLPQALASLPPNPYDGTPKPHVERIPHPRG
ncbi:RNA polymerase subunit sigma-70 [Kribbella shirazensis]|uniref:RNA polymerase sigma-70 factor (ECF subfamily) n=1 Tax=Kribbella shirazensis TaxID=1105143 RepID=A0A7X5VCE1_9ACTN|nr:RNA polymerase subunit sigma-70 [Kribbella shirazensis]NIK58201.1 RNA polymerase sigma-70 factor (ECF subfamily) [Kribbella shirazensis]